MHTRDIASRAPFVALHGIGLNIGGADPLDKSYIGGLQELNRIFKPRIMSDHLCFTQAGGVQSYELLPIVRNTSHLNFISGRIDELQQRLGRQYCLENVSAYISYEDDSIPEGEFLNTIAEKTGCGLLLDVNNVFVSAVNFGLQPTEELKRYNLSFVQQIHVAGHSTRKDFLFDTHDTPVCETVWDMLRSIVQSHPEIPVILENDDSNAALSDLLEELKFGALRCFA